MVTDRCYMLNQLLWKELVPFDSKQSKVCVHCAEYPMSAILNCVYIEVAELCTYIFFFSL